MIPDEAVEAAARRRDLFRGVDVVLKSGAGNIHRPFPYTDQEILTGEASKPHG